MLLVLAACGGTPTCYRTEDAVGDDDELGDHDATVGELVDAIVGVRSFTAVETGGDETAAEVEVDATLLLQFASGELVSVEATGLRNTAG